MAAPIPSRPAAGERSLHLDALKGFAIACVVLGHAIQRNLDGGSTNLAFLALGAFEMPLFMFLSGTVLSGHLRSPRWRWVGNRAVRLLVPFIAWTAIHFVLAGVPMQGFTPYIDFSGGFLAYVLRTFATPAAGLWYLPALMWCSAVLALLYPLRKRPLLLPVAGYAALVGLLYLRARIGIAGDYGLLRAVEYWLFFSVGFTWRELGHGLEFGKPARWAWLLLYPLAAPFVLVWVSALPLGVNTLGRLMLGLVGVAFSVVLVQLIWPLARAVGLPLLGRLTLGVYCVHMVLLRPGIGSGWTAVLVAWIVALVSSAALTWVLGRIPGVRGVLLGEWKTQRRAARARS